MSKEILKIVDNKYRTIPVIFENTGEIQDTENADKRFTKVKIWLMHTGLNQNESIFEKSVIEEALPTLSYIPIVGFISEDKYTGEKDFTKHQYILVKDENGIRKKYIGSAYGVILSAVDNNAHFEYRVCDDGEEREFLVVDGIMWNMFEDSTEIMNRDLVKGQSMELVDCIDSIEGYEDEDGILHFTKFMFRAACVLGDDVDPAMMNSTIEVQDTITDFTKQFCNELSKQISTFSKLINTQQGGVNMSKEVKPVNTDFTQSTMQLFSDVCNEVMDKGGKVEDYWHDYVSRYCVVDIQDNEVIVMDRSDHYNYYGIPYTVEGDKPIIDFEKACRKKVVYTNYDDGETPVVIDGAFNFESVLNDCETIAKDRISELETSRDEALFAKDEEITTLSEKIADIEPKYQEYVKAEEERIATEIENEKLAVFEKYEVALGENEDFLALRNNHSDFSVDDVKGKCAIMYAEANLFSVKEPKNTNSAIVVVPSVETDDTVVETKRYGAIAKR